MKIIFQIYKRLNKVLKISKNRPYLRRLFYAHPMLFLNFFLVFFFLHKINFHVGCPKLCIKKIFALKYVFFLFIMHAYTVFLKKCPEKNISVDKTDVNQQEIKELVAAFYNFLKEVP